jgi:glycosyltransferase involved in cell wall biosynthesis
MRILIVSPYFPPRSAIGALRVYAFAKHWACEGEQVTVLTTRKRDYQRGIELPFDGFEVVEVNYKVRWLTEALRNALRTERNGEAARVRTAAAWRPVKDLLRRVQGRTGIFGAGRMPDFTDRWVAPALRWAASQPPWDVVVSSGGPYTAHLVALAIKRRGLAPRLVADFRDLWVNHHGSRGLFPFTLRERVLERRCIEAADLLLTVSDELAGILREKTTTPVEVIFNGTDREEFEALPPQRYFPDNGKIRLVYTGSTYLDGQDPTPLLRSLALLRRQRPEVASRLELNVAGQESHQWIRLARRCDANGLIRDHGEVSRSTALRMQRDADALVLLDWKSSNAGVMTGKLFDYLGAKAPILVVGGRPTSCVSRIVGQSGRGVHLGEDAGGILEALVAAVETPSRLGCDPKPEILNTLTRRCQSLKCLGLVRRVADRAPQHART